LPFVVEKKVNETELGYVIYDSKDIIIELLSRGLAKLRGEKINSEHIDDYKDAEVEAQMAERGIWSEESKPEGAYRYLKKTWTDKEFFEKFKEQKLKGLVE
jgi:endonuclease YncB( thermonuclease family)